MFGLRLTDSSRRYPANVLFCGVLLAVAIVPFNSRAAFIDHGTYMTDTDSGLDWLKVDQTLGMSFNDVTAQLGVGGQFQGWSYADVFDIQQLWFNAGASSPMSGWSSANNGVVSGLLNAWGRTETFDEARVIHATVINSNQAVAIASDDPNQSLSFTQDFMSLNETTIAAGAANPRYGSALHRVSVPEPSCCWLVASALPFMLLRRRRKPA